MIDPDKTDALGQLDKIKDEVSVIQGQLKRLMNDLNAVIWTINGGYTDEH